MRMPLTMKLGIIAVASIFGAGVFAEGKMFVYPGSGQTAEQQAKDEGECKLWALEQSGFDPLSVPTVSAPPEQKRGGALKGAAAGAAVGAIVGDSDDAKKGAIAGGVLGRHRQSKNKRKQQQAAQQDQQAQAAQQQQLSADYRRAYTSCLQAKDYTVG